MLVFIIAGIVIGYPLFWAPALKNIAARGWDKTPCKIVSIQVKTHRLSNRNPNNPSYYYTPEVTFDYEYQGKTYTGDKYSFYQSKRQDGKKTKAELKKLQKEKNTFCYVNPRAPHEAVLFPGFRVDFLIGLFPLGFVAVGIMGLIMVIRRWNKPLRFVNTKIKQEFPNISTAPLRGVIGFTLTWNVFLGLMIVIALDNGTSAIALLLFSPFILIGLGLVVLVVWRSIEHLLQLPILHLDERTLSPGDPLTVAWKVPNPHAYHHMEIRLEGHEKINLGTIQNTVFTIVQLMTSVDEKKIAQGKCRTTIPANARISFAGTDSRTFWQVVIEGQRKDRPPVVRKYKIEIKHPPMEFEPSV